MVEDHQMVFKNVLLHSCNSRATERNCPGYRSPRVERRNCKSHFLFPKMACNDNLMRISSSRLQNKQCFIALHCNVYRRKPNCNYKSFKENESWLWKQVMQMIFLFDFVESNHKSAVDSRLEIGTEILIVKKIQKLFFSNCLQKRGRQLATFLKLFFSEMENSNRLWFQKI